MTTENLIFFSIYIPLTIGMYATWIIGSWWEKRQAKKRWDRLMKAESGAIYIPMAEIMRLEQEVKAWHSTEHVSGAVQVLTRANGATAKRKAL